MGPMMRHLIARRCQDACGTITTDRTVEGAPVYRCPGCDSEWIELDERTAAPTASPPNRPATAPAASAPAASGTQAPDRAPHE